MPNTEKLFTAVPPKVKECVCEHEYQDITPSAPFLLALTPADNNKREKDS